MTGPLPRDIWHETFDEGERRLTRSNRGLAATGLVGGIDVMLGLLAVVVVTGALTTITTYEVAHVAGSLTFGIAFVLVTLGRSELFTENFLVPVGAVLAGRGSRLLLLRLWLITFALNLVGMAVFAWIFTIDGFVTETVLNSAGALGDTVAERDAVASLASAIAAGTVMTLFTWVTVAADTDIARLAVALLVGFLLLAPVLNHAVVSSGEILFAAFAGTSDFGTWEALRNLAIAVAGNLIGGIGFVTVTRLVQVSGEPE